MDEGEDYETYARRELKEETGIENVKLDFLFPVKQRSPENNANRRIYRCTHTAPFQLQPKEVQGGSFMNMVEIDELEKQEKLYGSGVYQAYKPPLKNERTKN